MITKDVENEFDVNLTFSEYIASFFNPEAVSKVKAARDVKKDGRFMDDKQFEEMIRNKEFLNPNYSRENISANDKSNIVERKGARDVRLPKELSGILKINRDNF